MYCKQCGRVSSIFAYADMCWECNTKRIADKQDKLKRDRDTSKRGKISNSLLFAGIDT